MFYQTGIRSTRDGQWEDRMHTKGRSNYVSPLQIAQPCDVTDAALMSLAAQIQNNFKTVVWSNMADGPCADGAGFVEKDESSVNDDSASVCDLKTISENVSRPAKVKMSFYIESKSDVTSDKCESESVAEPKNSSTDHNKRVEYAPGKEEDCRKKRCTDRYDSSESSDRLVDI